MLPEALVDQPEIEYLDGQPHPKVSPKLSHSLVQGALCRILHRCSGKRGRVGPELDVYPSGGNAGLTKFVPDVAYVSMERLRALPAADREEPPFSPDIAVEVWSPANDRNYLELKIARYLATGSVLVLDVDPYARTIIAHDGSTVRTYKKEEHFEHPAMPWLRFDVAEAFADLDDLI
ncbi:MAG: Uma2 family endonuclease [Candidatus Eremiobacteraeota bacterium]|nr:Uma2 family endonuclease [Candidatus Eremiobacteraeota bacterium]